MNIKQHETIHPGLQRHCLQVLIFWPVSFWQTESEYCDQSEQSQVQDSKVQRVSLLGFPV